MSRRFARPSSPAAISPATAAWSSARSMAAPARDAASSTRNARDVTNPVLEWGVPEGRPFSLEVPGHGYEESVADRNPGCERLYGRGAPAAAGAPSRGRNPLADGRPAGGQALGRDFPASGWAPAALAGEGRRGRLVGGGAGLLLSAPWHDP